MVAILGADMNVHQLELFYHVALNEGVSAAARALDKEQPTLSKQINDLENTGYDDCRIAYVGVI